MPSLRGVGSESGAISRSPERAAAARAPDIILATGAPSFDTLKESILSASREIPPHGLSERNNRVRNLLVVASVVLALNQNYWQLEAASLWGPTKNARSRYERSTVLLCKARRRLRVPEWQPGIFSIIALLGRKAMYGGGRTLPMLHDMLPPFLPHDRESIRYPSASGTDPA